MSTATQDVPATAHQLSQTELDALAQIAKRAHAWMVRMIWEANHRDSKLPGDPKVGGHPASCSSALHLATALQLSARNTADFYCGKPHMSPIDHALHHAQSVFRHADGKWFDETEAEAVMSTLRAFSENGEPVFQSYHAEADPDSWRVLPTGTVGIPQVNAVYLALAFNYAIDHGWATDIPKHFWCIMGDSELREGSLMEAMPDVAERELGNVTWIVDYNRQNLDGTRIPNKRGLRGTDADRIERTFHANGWEVIQLRHGTKRHQLFALEDGRKLREQLENGFSDYEFQALLWKADASLLRQELLVRDDSLQQLLAQISDKDLLAALGDLGGHDLDAICNAYAAARVDKKVPTLIIAHTVKGWGLSCTAMPGNHSALPDEEEVNQILKAQGLTPQRPFERASISPEADDYLTKRGEYWRTGIGQVEKRIENNRAQVAGKLAPTLPLPNNFNINLSMMPMVHTQWLWGQVAGKLVRIVTHDELSEAGLEVGRELNDEEQQWAQVADLMCTMSPDVGTSTNINPAMDAKVYGPETGSNFEAEHELRERGRPELYAHSEAWTRHIRFEIAEANCMSAAGSFGKMGQYAGVALMPMMTVYDFFIKRALDQLYYNLYWRSSFILLGTPSGVTLSPEGAQHSWKSDLQMPSLITWEPAYAKEMEWILADAVQRHVANNNHDREGVLVRAVTRSLKQKELMKRLKAQARFANSSTFEIENRLRQDVLAGGYKLIDRSDDNDYQAGDNVVTILVMGALVPEVLEASDRLAEKHGIHADVIVVTSADLLLGRFAAANNYAQLTALGVDGRLHLNAAGASGDSNSISPADAQSLAARFVPIVSIADGEEGLLDNAGSIVGVPQVALATRKFSKCGRPDQVYGYHGMDADSLIKAAQDALQRTAARDVHISQ